VVSFIGRIINVQHDEGDYNYVCHPTREVSNPINVTNPMSKKGLL
jgi:hypothetical protein